MPRNNKLHPPALLDRIRQIVFVEKSSYGVASKLTGLTRCSIAGICARNGWKTGTGGGGNVMRLTILRAPKERPAMPPKPVKPSNDNAVVLWEIPKGGCHWPVDCDGEHKLFCAEPRAFPDDRNRNYCPYHHRISIYIKRAAL